MQSIGFSDLIQSGFCCCQLEANLGPQQFVFYILLEVGTIQLMSRMFNEAEALTGTLYDGKLIYKVLN